ncbi:uncharacterized protein LOC131307055 [Rhododendron vialii]|uniref:uncharacterized protein LOC131307055 n=1 Tax=Rhododendron vialii TaxID=182163 RepID=UPI0026605B9B|nr:uncharacterized protein LOC131307055 [Rhododendron vialii]
MIFSENLAWLLRLSSQTVYLSNFLGTPQRKIQEGTMDDYNFSISDSWSFENDIRSEESVSHNSRDYTLEFTTDQIFESREDMLAWVRSVSLKYGIVVVILNSAKLKGGKLPKCILGCERGGKYELPGYLVEGQSLQRNTGTRKCDCPFQLRAKLDGLTPIQYVIRQLLKKHYLHQFLTNSDTNEITDIIWVHPMSLELSVNFPSVLIIDATYKTNE